MADVKKRETESREAAYRERLRFRVAEADKQLGLVVACRERLRIAKQAVDHAETAMDHNGEGNIG